MSLESGLDGLLVQLFDGSIEHSISAEQLIECIDLTLLDDQASDAALRELKDRAEFNSVAAVCVLPKHLHLFYPLKNSKLATVINFPLGNDDLDLCLQQIDAARSLGAVEIDYVLPYTAYLGGDKNYALGCYKAVYELCAQNQLCLKVIIETGAFSDMQTIYGLSRELIDLGCSFLKTSTGKIPLGASLHGVFSLLCAIKDSNCIGGLKVSGGVKTPVQAVQFALMAELMIGKGIDKSWFRIGASTLLDALIKPE